MTNVVIALLTKSYLIIILLTHINVIRVATNTSLEFMKENLSKENYNKLVHTTLEQNHQNLSKSYPRMKYNKPSMVSTIPDNKVSTHEYWGNEGEKTTKNSLNSSKLSTMDVLEMPKRKVELSKRTNGSLPKQSNQMSGKSVVSQISTGISDEAVMRKNAGNDHKEEQIVYNNEERVDEPTVIKLKVSKYRQQDTYRLLGEVAERAFITRHYGFINLEEDQFRIRQLINYVESYKKGYEIETFPFSKTVFDTLDSAQKTLLCKNFINDNTVLREKNIRFDDSVQTTAIRMVHEIVDFEFLKMPRRKYKMISCPSIDKITSTPDTHYVLPLFYTKRNSDLYAFVFTKNKRDEEHDPNLQVYSLSKILPYREEDGEIPKPKQKPKSDDEVKLKEKGQSKEKGQLKEKEPRTTGQQILQNYNVDSRYAGSDGLPNFIDDYWYYG